MYGVILDIYIRCPCYNGFSIPACTYFTRFLGSQFHKKFIGSQFRKIYCVGEMYELFYVFVSQQSFVYWKVVVSWDLANESVSFVLQNGAMCTYVCKQLSMDGWMWTLCAHVFMCEFMYVYMHIYTFLLIYVCMFYLPMF